MAIDAVHKYHIHTTFQMKMISPICIPFLQMFKHPDPGWNLSLTTSWDYSWPTRGCQVMCEREWGERQENQVDHVNIYWKRTLSKRNPVLGALEWWPFILISKIFDWSQLSSLKPWSPQRYRRESLWLLAWILFYY